MTGRVLSEDEIQTMAETWDLSTATREEYGESIIITNLIATIRDRDKTIVELDRQYAVVATKAINLELQNEVMLSALERIHTYGVEKPFDDHSEAIAFHHAQIISADALAQVKALTVSKQEESTVSEVACEQPTKNSLHVARQNIPTHTMEQINRLAQEVASDMQWREGEQK